MNAYLEKFKAYTAEHPPKYDGDARSMMELFYQYYTELNPVDNDQIKGCYLEMEGLLEPLGEAVGDEIFDRMCSLYAVVERRAFLEGFRAGGQWVLEVLEK